MNELILGITIMGVCLILFHNNISIKSESGVVYNNEQIMMYNIRYDDDNEIHYTTDNTTWYGCDDNLEFLDITYIHDGYSYFVWYHGNQKFYINRDEIQMIVD